MSTDEADAAEGATVGIAIGAGIEVDAEMSSSGRKQRLESDPDGTEFRRVSGPERFDGTKAVAPCGQGRAGAGAMTISVLSMGPSADGIEVQGFAGTVQTRSGIGSPVPER